MIENFNSGIIDVSSVMLIVNKLKLYIDNEEKIINNIKNSLDLFDDYYSSQNNKVLDTKKKNLCDALDILIQKRKDILNI